MVTLVSSAVFSLFVYFVLSYLLVSQKVTIPVSVLIFTLILGLTRYYSKYNQNNYSYSGKSGLNENSHSISNRNEGEKNESPSTILFLAIFAILILICALFSKENMDIFTPWNEFNAINLIQLGAAIALSFFIPGYAMVLILTKNHRVNLVLKVLLAYIFSILITSLTVYLSAVYLDGNVSGHKILLISIYLTIITALVVYHRIYRIVLHVKTNGHKVLYHFISNIANKLPKILEENASELLVFASLFGLLIIYTYYVYGGITIGDQWYHQNRALLFLTGHFKEVVLASGDATYPPLQSALLAGLTALSGTPLVNAYASIAFLNMSAVFAFYYFCSSWFPESQRRAALIASTLFLLGSGFGWIYILYLTETNPIISPISSIATFRQDRIESSDITLSANFMIAAFPDFSTALIYISIPAGFLLLGLVRLKFNNKYAYTAMLSILSSAGILFHEEFYIFIIVSCILPLVFNIKNRNSVYLAFIFSFTFVYMLDLILPARYFTSNEILGIPLITLNVLFVIIMWTLYAAQQNLQKRFRSTLVSLAERTKKVTYYRNRISFLFLTSIPKVMLVWAVVYVCGLSFIVWTSLPVNYVQAHTSGFTTPWYLYPLRLGIIGLFGLASVLSYLFKRFEKEVFVFGIIALVAFLAGPYYNEHRFSKYVMVGMIGFASLIIFKLLIFVAGRRPIILGIVIGSIVISASLSTLMFIGYNALVVQTQDYTQALARRNFPNVEEMNMLELMRSNIAVGANTYNVASFPSEYNLNKGGIITKLHTFSGLPISKIVQSPLTLNSTTLGSFYHLLDISDTKYIIMPKNGFNEKELTDPVRFALENFQHIYEDNNYLILEVPSLRGPSATSDSELAIIYKKDRAPFPVEPNRTNLQFNNTTFDLKNDTLKFISIQKGNQSEKATLYGFKNIGGKTVWSKSLDSSDKDSVNYIQAKFRILPESKTGKDSAGIKWKEGNTAYVVYITSGGLELRQQATNNNKTSLLFQNAEIDKNEGIWYVLKVSSLKDSINIYLNSAPKIKFPRTLSEEILGNISRIGINSVNNAVEFEPIQIGKVPPSAHYDKKNNYDYNYPLSILAMSLSGYSTFTDDDYSAFAKRNIILPFDPQDWSESKFNEYLNYARSGGTLIVMNSDDNFNGKFNKLLSVEPTSNKTIEYTHISRENNLHSFLNVSGIVRGAEVKPSSDARVLATYRNEDNKVIAPFVIEKHFPSGGKIILVDDKGYFDTIYANPKKYFSTLQNLTGIFYIRSYKPAIPQPVVEPTKRFIGDIKMSGEVSINSSSFSLINASASSANLNSKAISIFDKDKKMNRHFNNVSIANIRLFGPYTVFIDSVGNLALPSENSQYDYIETLLPNEFNMTVKLSDKASHAEILTKQKSSLGSIKVYNESKIEFYNIRTGNPSLKSVPVLIKDPIIMINGNTTFKGTNFYGGLPTRNPPLAVAGHVKAKLDFVDHYHEAYGNGTRSQYVTYLKSITIDGETNEGGQLQVPGDIPSSARERGLSIPLYEILSSSNNILILIASIIITLFVGFSLRRFGIGTG